MFPIFTPSAVPTSREVETDRWHAQAEADYALCRAFADRHDAHLKRSLAGLRVGWEKMGHEAYGILLPDPLPCAGSDDDWYLYYVWGEVLLRRTLTERSERRMDRSGRKRGRLGRAAAAGSAAYPRGQPL